MGFVIPNAQKGKWAFMLELPAASDKLVWILFQGVETDANIRNCVTVADLIATALDEATFTGYARIALTTPGTATPDNTNAWLLGDIGDPTWNPTSVQSIKRIALCYDPDGSNTNTTLKPMFVDDCANDTVSGTPYTYQVFSTGFSKAHD